MALSNFIQSLVYAYSKNLGKVALYLHEPVMLEPTLLGLALRPNGFYVDGTYGRGGHSKALLRRLGESGRLLVIDQDPQAIEDAMQLSAADSRCLVRQGSFENVGQWVSELGLRPDGVMLDLGVSSPQLDDPKRGFSFLRDGPLDMRMDTTQGLTAFEWLMTVEEKALSDVLWRYGEEKLSRRIARAIVRRREQGELPKTTLGLAEIVAQCYPSRKQVKHPATRTFQAIRIHINGELSALENTLIACAQSLAVGGRLAVISFHSLEDRIVKQFFRDYGRQDLPDGLPVTGSGLEPLFKLWGGKKTQADPAEIERNPRARSAVLRVGEKTREIEN